MNIGLIRVARTHFALTLEEEEDVRPILWLYEHFLREAMEFPFHNPANDFWERDGGASTGIMVDAFADGEPYVYFADSRYAAIYCDGLANSTEWEKAGGALSRLKNYFNTIADGDVTEMLFEYMLDEFALIINCLCDKKVLDDSYELAKTIG